MTPRRRVWIATPQGGGTRAASVQGVAEGFRDLGWDVATAVRPTVEAPAVRHRGEALQRISRAVKDVAPRTARRRRAGAAAAGPPLPLPAQLAYERYSAGGSALVAAARHHHVPLVLHVHASIDQERRRSSWRWRNAEKEWLGAADYLWFVSPEVERYVRQVLGVETAGLVVGNGVRGLFFQKHLKPHDGAFTVGIASSFQRFHDHDVALHALRLTSASEIVLDLPGSGPGRESVLRAVADDAHLRDRVRIPGWLDQAALADRMQHWDVALVPGAVSQAHGRSLKLAEAAACGLPIVAADVPANQLGIPARFVPPHDAEAIASALVELKGSTSLRDELGAAAAAAAQDFRWRAVVERGLTIVR